MLRIISANGESTRAAISHYCGRHLRKLAWSPIKAEAQSAREEKVTGPIDECGRGWRLFHDAVGRSALAMGLALAAAGCEPISITMMGVGAGAGVSHQLGGIVYKTFPEPAPKVKKAALAALKRMAIAVNGVEKIDNGEAIKATAADRNIEIEIESLTSNTTRMRAVARKDGSLFVDSATAVEIIVQTEKVLGSG